ncbi:MULTISPECIES: DUF7504 family protein [Halolamina]|uniref:RecA-superfamily ATPase, KaiC/GvpD/RAD55 family n=1 Tax=Halolamina pelagica TaxID=699431 RepID=A0A1I5QCX7_9EURY|nr:MULTISPECIES: hypothetical protein [Halolamina]NHX35201.1 hypothetical protein [Halolamina sp. R1-12]SFP43967.1 hypothetical protein SAMN05216277_103362 [Halolamina pelagica]
MEEPTAETLDSAIPIAELAAGRSVLVRGPAMSGKYDLLLRLLDALADHVLLVSTSRQATGARADFAEYGDPDRFGIVDCASRAQGRDGGEDALVRYASSPKNLTEIGVKFTDLVDTVQDDGVEHAAVGVHSVSELLMYWETERVYQFLRVLLAEAQGLDWPAVAVVDDDAATDQAVTTLTQPFDAVITTRRDDDGRAFRYQESGRELGDWTAF